METMRSRARAIVVRASKEATTRYVKTWLFQDERGTWEREALTLMSEIKAYVYSWEFIEEQVSLRLRFMANTAVLNKSKKRNAG